MQNKNDNKSQKPKYVIKVIRTAEEKKEAPKIPSDVMGSYTGIPYDGEVPVQDADDL